MASKSYLSRIVFMLFVFWWNTYTAQSQNCISSSPNNCSINDPNCLSCPAIGTITVGNLSGSGALLSWPIGLRPNTVMSYNIAISENGVQYTGLGSVGPFYCTGGTACYTLSGLKPGTAYKVVIEHVCQIYNTGVISNGACNVSQTSNFSAVINVNTLALPAGACGCVPGSYNVSTPVLNSNATIYYCDAVTSTTTVTQSSVNFTLKSTGVTLNPGFLTALSGTGSMNVVAFNPATCAVTRRVNGEDILQENMKGLPGEENLFSIKIFPNPSGGVFHITPGSQSETIAVIRVTNAVGRLILLQSNTRRIDLSNQPVGLYFYQVNTSAGTYTGKIIKNQ